MVVPQNIQRFFQATDAPVTHRTLRQPIAIPDSCEERDDHLCFSVPNFLGQTLFLAVPVSGIRRDGRTLIFPSGRLAFCSFRKWTPK